MMVATIRNIRLKATTAPSECLGLVIMELLKITTKINLEFMTKIFRFVCEAISPARVFLGTRPSNQLELTLVYGAILTLAKFVVPHFGSFANFLVCRPV
jgi:hypothetical protein